MRYMIGSGYVPSPKNEVFLNIWANNFEKNPIPEGCTRIVILGVGGGFRPVVSLGHRVEWVGLDGNCGHVGALLSGEKKHGLCGWTAGVLALAMMAYCDESDFIYREQDCLCFGPWVEKLYEDMGDGFMAFGGPMKSPPYMECAQSLFIVRNSFIPQFVMTMIEMGDERKQDRFHKEDNLPERKFHRIRERWPDLIKPLSFGVDRERPMPIDNVVWYAQQFTTEEIHALERIGKI